MGWKKCGLLVGVAFVGYVGCLYGAFRGMAASRAAEPCLRFGQLDVLLRNDTDLGGWRMDGCTVTYTRSECGFLSHFVGHHVVERSPVPV